jgi:hypothetical protein
VAVDIGHPDRPAGVAQPRQGARDQRAAAAEDERARVRRHDVAHRGAHGPGGGKHAIDPDHARGRVAAIAANADVEVAAILGPEARGQIALAQRRRRELGPTGPSDGIDRHADDGPGSRHRPMLPVPLAPTIYSWWRHGGVVLMGTRGLCTAELGVRFPPPPSIGRVSRSSVHRAVVGLKTALRRADLPTA